jgi:hypothetical protein
LKRITVTAWAIAAFAVIVVIGTALGTYLSLWADILFVLPAGIVLGYCVIGPLIRGVKPFTSPGDFSSERRLH